MTEDIQQTMKMSLFSKEPRFFSTTFGRFSDESDDFCWLSFWLWSSSFIEYSLVGY